MSILTANLKHLYQRRGMYLAYIMLGFFIFFSIAIPFDNRKTGEGRFIGLVVFEFVVGLFAAIVQMEILTKPFAFNLPGHRQMVKKFIFSVGIVTSLIGSMLFLLYPNLNPLWRLLVLCSAFSAGMIFYLAGIWCSFRTKQPMIFISFLAVALFAGKFLNLNVMLENAIIYYPQITALLALVFSVVMWFFLNDENLARKNCLVPWIGFAEIFDRNKFQTFQQTKRCENLIKQLKDHPRPWIENIFIDRISRQVPLSTARFVWGSLYTSFSINISQWRNFICLALFLALLLGYVGSRMWIFIAFVPMMAFVKSRPTLYSNLLTAGGRNERFFSTLIIVFVAGVIMAAFIALMILISIPLAAIIPQINYHGLEISYHVIGLRILYAPLVFLPLAYTIYMTLYRKPILMLTALFVLLYSLWIVNLICQKEIELVFTPLISVVLSALSWIIFVLVLRHISTNRCLIK